MRFDCKFYITCIFLVVACSTFAGTSKSSANQDTATLQMQLAPEIESSMQESTSEQNDDWLEAHESNGPEGTRGVPMQRMSLFQCGLVLAILAAGGSLVALAKKTNPSGKPSRP